MKRFAWKGFLISLLILNSFTGISQEIKEFAKDSTFIEQFKEFAERNIGEQDEDSLESFVQKWQSGYFTEDIKNSFIDICNLMLDNKATRDPHFINYFNLVLEFQQNENIKPHYSNWEKGIVYIFENEKYPLRTINQYFKNTRSLFIDKILYSTTATDWIVSSDDYKMMVDNSLRIEFKRTDLKCKIKKDSIDIFETQGVFYPISGIWKGKNGFVTWERAGYSAEEVKAELKNYTIDLNKSGYKADSALFFNKIYFEKPVLGRLSDEVVHIMAPERAIYPEFNTYQKRFKIENIYPDINYDGGFTMKGANLLGSGDANNDAYLFINKNDTTIISAVAETFMFKKGRIVSNNAQITIHLKNDSIYHPGILFDYITDNKEVSLSQSDRIISKSPYFNSYHNISMNFDRLLWQIDSKNILFTKRRGATIGNATYISSNFYNQIEFEKIMLRDAFHPLISIKNYAAKIKSEKFTGGELARFLKFDDYQIKQMLMYLSVDGFLFYDTDNDEAIVKQKLYDYIDARFGKIDYDVIRFNSTTENLVHNGILDLNTFDLNINGVEKIFLSDSQNVVIFPKHRQIVMQKNRGFNFGGIIVAGLFTFYGKEFHFDYDTFKIDLYNVDSLRIKVQTAERDMYNNPVLAHIQNTVEIISGELLIDNRYNKSGLQNFPQYPIFKSNKKSYVYYDYANIYNGVYKRDSFYFELEPFVIDSLDNFTTKSLRFGGRFYSSNIFPPFNDSIYMRPDYSMGFRRKTPPEGFPLYSGKGTYNNIIDLSNRGLKGSGTLKYLTSTILTDSIIFFPDSTEIHANDFTIAQKTSGIEYPAVKSQKVNIQWYPYKDVMYAEQTKMPFEMYNNNSLLSGILTLKPIGLTGKGTMNLEKAELRSKLFYFNAQKFNSDSTSFSLKSINKKDFNFITENLSGKIDFTSQTGDFRSNESFTIAKFPKNLYVSYLDKFNWNITKDEIAIESSPQADTTASAEVIELAKLKDDQLPGALYMSIHRSQDSLRFSSTKASYSLRDSSIKATEVEYIRVADALIFPDEGDVTIGNLAKMKTLVNSEIIANSESRYHRIYNSKININGRYDYLATGDYDYIDENKAVQVVHFTDIFVNANRQTEAKATITAEDNFTLSPVYQYRGNIILYGANQFLTFKGGVKLDYTCPRDETHYTYFESEINPDSIFIPFPESTRSMSGRELFAASFITKDSSHVYSRFMDRRRDPNDKALVKASGYLHYQKNANKFIVADKSKFLNPDTTGVLVSLQRDFCLQHGEGEVDLGIELGQVKLSPAGSVNHLLDKNEIKLELVIPLDFFFSGPALDTLVKDIQSQKLDAMSLTSGFFEKNITELTSKSDFHDLNYQITLYANEAKLPKDLQHTFLLGNVKLKWFTETGSYLNYGKIGIATINNKPVSKYVDGYFQLLKRRSGDLMKFYIKLPNNNYYYFTYSRGVMQTLSNNPDFVEAIKALKNKARKMKTPRGETPYRYIIATDQNLAQFLRDMRLFEEAQAAKEEELKQQQEQEDQELPEQQKIEESVQDTIPVQNQTEGQEEGM